MFKVIFLKPLPRVVSALAKVFPAKDVSSSDPLKAADAYDAIAEAYAPKVADRYLDKLGLKKAPKPKETAKDAE